MKKLISMLTVVIILTSCTKQDAIEQIQETQKRQELQVGIPVNFSYSTLECERPQIVFKGETFSDTTTITSDSTVTLREDQLYTVSFTLTADRCSSGAMILSGDNPDEINFWMGSYPANAEKSHVNLESNYYVVILGE